MFCLHVTLRVCVTFFPKDPSLVHAGDEECGRLSQTHEEVCDCQVNDENIGWCTQAPAPAYTHTHTHTHTAV